MSGDSDRPRTAVIYCRGESGLDAPQVFVEVHLSGGVPQFSLVGLPETAVRESRQRVRSAIINSGFDWPDDRITANLAPADLPKYGGRYDLAIAIGVLKANGTIRGVSLDGIEFIGELGLTGEIRAVGRVLPASIAAARAGRRLCVGPGDLAEAGLADFADVATASNLTELVELLNWDRLQSVEVPRPMDQPRIAADLKDVHGQVMARRALEIAAAGGLSLLMIGPPGSGKTMLASRLAGILPAMTDDEALESACIHSLSTRGVDAVHFRQRPFRSPHHSASSVSLVGGGPRPMPGEISLAHNGVLFLDELPEFARHTLEQLREPLESGEVHLARAAHRATYPSRCQLVAAMNPCPCGWAGDPTGRCRCTPEIIARYRNKISGPLLDRIDMHVDVPAVKAAMLLTDKAGGETSDEVLLRVSAAQSRQRRDRGCLNRDADPRCLLTRTGLSDEARAFLLASVERLELSARAQHRMLRVARTIADLDDCAQIGQGHVAQAIGFRCFDRPVVKETRRP